MKISAFVAGGLAGAAAVIIWQRNRRMAWAAANRFGHRMKSRYYDMKDEAADRMWNFRFAGSRRGRHDDDGFDADDMPERASHVTEHHAEHDGRDHV